METIASTHNNLWPGFNVVFVSLLQVIIAVFYMATTFLVIPLYIGTLPAAWRALVIVVWTLSQSFCHVGWLYFTPSHVPPLYPALVALASSVSSWVWSVALIRDTYGLNGK